MLLLLLTIIVIIIVYINSTTPLQIQHKDNLEVDEKTFINNIIDSVKLTNDREDNLANKVAEVVTQKNQEFDSLANAVAEKVSSEYCKKLEKNQARILNHLNYTTNNQKILYDYLMKDLAPRTSYGYKNPESIPRNNNYPHWGTPVRATNSNEMQPTTK